MQTLPRGDIAPPDDVATPPSTPRNYDFRPPPRNLENPFFWGTKMKCSGGGGGHWEKCMTPLLTPPPCKMSG